MNCAFELSCAIASCAQYCELLLLIVDQMVASLLGDLPHWLAEPLAEQWRHVTTPLHGVIAAVSPVCPAGAAHV